MDETALPIVATVPVPAYGVTVQLDSIDRGYELIDIHSGLSHYARWADLEHVLASVTADVPHCLLLGVIAEAAGRHGPLTPFRLGIAAGLQDRVVEAYNQCCCNSTPSRPEQDQASSRLHALLTTCACSLRRGPQPRNQAR